MSLTALGFLFAFLAGSVMALTKHRIYGLLTYVAVFYLHPPSRWWGQGILEAPRWALIAAGVTLLAILVNRRDANPVDGFFQQKFVWGIVAFILWLFVQSAWALDPTSHGALIEYYAKFLIAVYMIYKCVDSVAHLRLFLWAHVLGCLYLAWIAFKSYGGGRFEGFGGPGLSEANAAALVIVTSVLVAASLFLAGKLRDKVAVVGIMPILVNAVATTISRSGFLAFVVGGLVFNYFSPSRISKRVRVLSVLGVLLLAMLTGPIYWARIGTLAYRGEVVEGVDTGASRLLLLQVQFQMAKQHPLGCGNNCTTVLSPLYLEERYLDRGGRSSHNTFMTMLVEHGVPGAMFYLLTAGWVWFGLRALARHFKGMDGPLPVLLPGIAASLGAMFLADMFVQYTKLEVRFWFLAILMVMLRWIHLPRAAVDAPATESQASSSRAASPALSPSRE